MDAFLAIIIRFIQILAELITWALFVYVLLSWFSTGRTQFGVWLDKIVRPVLRPFRWARIGVLDLSVIAAFFIIQYGSNILIQGLLLLAQKF